MIVCVRKSRTVNEPATANTSERPSDGSSWAGLGRGSPTERPPHCLQPLLKAPTNLKPQHGQIVTFLPQKEQSALSLFFRKRGLNERYRILYTYFLSRHVLCFCRLNLRQF